MVCRKLMLVALLIFFLACPLTVFSTQTRGIKPAASELQNSIHIGNYHALIIGINNYTEWNPLKTAVKDAKVLKEVLVERYGFKNDNVILRTDDAATRVKLILDLRKLASKLGDQDNLLIYYAGHGQLDDLTGDGYWIPVEGELKNPVTWISHSTIKSILSSERVKAKNIVVVADSCYSGTLLRGGPSLLSIGEEGYDNKLLKVAGRRSRQVITSGGLEPVADGGRDGHSLFAYYFLKALKENNRRIIDLENLFHSYVWKPVTEIGDQRPNAGRLKTPMDEDGQFILVMLNEAGQPSSFSNVNLELQAERKRLAEKEARIERERQELEQLKALIEQNKKFEAESKRLEEEKLKLASIPKSVSAPRVSLRKKPIEISNRMKITNMLEEYNFFYRNRNPSGAFDNVFIDKEDGTIMDKATGLMWQKGGSSSSLVNFDAKKYIKQLNRQKFAGYFDWRLPTIEELASLLELKKTLGVHIDSVFDNKQATCWSADKGVGRYRDLAGGWIVSFKHGEIKDAHFAGRPSGSFMGGAQNLNHINYVKAVRSVE